MTSADIVAVAWFAIIIFGGGFAVIYAVATYGQRWRAPKSAKAEAVKANVATVPERTLTKSEIDWAAGSAKAVLANADLTKVAEVTRAAQEAAARRPQPWPNGAPPAEAVKAEAAKRKIFISYRRQIDAAIAGRISDLLIAERAFDIFMDVDARRFGHDFVSLITGEVAKCDVLLAVIGRDWLDTHDDAGDRRLDDPNDWVRLEIATALKREIPVIPILVDGAKIPKAAQLPTDLQQLPRRIAFELRNAYFRTDIDGLVQQLKS
jgi:hypothetical protein